jgi:hypothetical protein
VDATIQIPSSQASFLNAVVSLAATAFKHKKDSRVRLKTQTVGVILIFSPGVACLGQFFAAAQDEKRNDDEKADACDGPDDCNVIHVVSFPGRSLYIPAPRLK